MAHTYTKNPDLGQAFIPGYGRVRDGELLVGEKYAAYTQGPAPLLVPAASVPSPYGEVLPPVMSSPMSEPKSESEPSASEAEPLVDGGETEPASVVEGVSANELVSVQPMTAPIGTEAPVAETDPSGEVPPVTEGGSSDSDDESTGEVVEEALTVEDIKTASKQDLLGYAEANGVEIPESVKKVKDLRAHLLGALFPDA